ncbi:MAG TPA: SRPBCC family protein [Actinophytocola sp.]|nr:SRPBCC family protein [Actinophytocola sp.]
MSERASLRTVDGQPVLRFERRLRHSPAKVWRAITEPAELAHWFPATVEAEPHPGAPMRFTFPEEAVVDGKWDGEVLEFDPPKVYMFRWNTDVLRFELIPDGDGCHLVFTQTLGGGWVGRLGAGRTAAGWDACLAVLLAQLAGEQPPPPEDWPAPAEAYIEEFGLAEGSVHETPDGVDLHFARDLVWKPPADVWSLLTEDTELNDHVPAGRLLHAEAPRELTYEWLHDNEPAGTVTWKIIADDELGVRVEVIQTVPSRLGHLLPPALAAWQVRLELFFATTQGAPRRPWPADRVAELTEHYRTKLAP